MKEVFQKAFYKYGYVPLLWLKDEYEELEMFEECAAIHEVLEHYRRLGVEIPTSCTEEVLDDWCYDIQKMAGRVVSDEKLMFKMEAICYDILANVQQPERNFI